LLGSISTHQQQTSFQIGSEDFIIESKTQLLGTMYIVEQHVQLFSATNVFYQFAYLHFLPC